MTKTAYIDFKAVRDAVGFPVVLSHYGIETVGQGDQVKILCPFHDDKNPTCGINHKRGLFNCFACHTGGHIIDFVLLMEDLNPDDPEDRKKAAHRTAEIGGYDPSAPPKKAAKTTRARKPAKTRKATDATKSDAAAPTHNEPLDLDKINMTLDPEHPFFEAHGISQDAIELFELGYTSTGIMKGRIVIPIHNANGDVVAFAGRYADEDVPDDIPRYKLPKNFHRGLELFNLHRAKMLSTKHLTIVEGYWSAMRLHLEGIPVVATLGTSISDEQVELITRHGYRHVSVVFDGDDQGRKGAQSVVEQLSHHVYVRCLDLPDGIKPDTMSDDVILRLKP